MKDNRYCLACNNYFTATDLDLCPHCGAVGDEIEVIEDEDYPLFDTEWEPTEEELEAMYQDYEGRRIVENAVLLIGVQ